jgi:ubiquinone biosynthesis protein Coq4
MARPFPLYRARTVLLTFLIIQAVPALNRLRPRSSWLHSLDALRHFPAQSWGAELAAFLDNRGFDDFLPNYEAHDAFHTLLEYETDVHGELRLQAFMLGNRSASVAGRGLFVVGLLLMPELWPQLQRDYKRGRQSAQLGAWSVPALLAHDIRSLRAQLAPLGARKMT